MTKRDFLKKIKDFPDDAEMYIQERGCDNAHTLDDVIMGWYVDGGDAAPEVIDGDEDPEDFDIPPDQEKVICVS